MEIEEIKIILNVNIPMQKEPIELTSDILHYEKQKQYSLSKYPFFCYNYKYNMNEIMKIGEYEKIVHFFFNKSYMSKKINEFKSVKLLSEGNFKYINHNIQVMMNLLLPTTFPTIDNFETSFDKYIKTDKNFLVSTIFNDQPILPQLFNFNKKSNNYTKFSFLKINGKVYTITKIIWLNDFYNHPLYNSFFNFYKAYQTWAKKESKSIIQQIEDNKNKLKYEESEKNTINDKLTKLSTTYTDLKLRNNELYTMINNTPKNIENINEQIDLIKNIFEFSKSTRLPIPSSFETKMNELLKIINKYKILLTISQKYITEQGTISGNYDEEEENIKKVLETYKYFIKYNNLLKTITLDSSTKIEENIKEQTSLNEIISYILLFKEEKKIEVPTTPTPSTTPTTPKTTTTPTTTTTTTTTTPSIITTPSITTTTTTTTTLDPNIEKKLEVGLTFINPKEIDLPKYEIYLNIDLIEGEINNTNFNDIYCKYKDIYIKNEIEFFMSNSRQAKYNRVFFSLPDFLKSKTQKEQNKSVKKQNGGLKKTLKKRRRFTKK
jgi:hypothetical protein